MRQRRRARLIRLGFRPSEIDWLPPSEQFEVLAAWAGDSSGNNTLHFKTTEEYQEWLRNR